MLPWTADTMLCELVMILVPDGQVEMQLGVGLLGMVSQPPQTQQIAGHELTNHYMVIQKIGFKEPDIPDSCVGAILRYAERRPHAVHGRLCLNIAEVHKSH